MTNKAGATLKVGVEGLKGNTPKTLKVIYRTLMAAVFIWAAAKMAFPEIPKPTADIVTRILDFGTPLMYGISQMFGYERPE